MAHVRDGLVVLMVVFTWKELDVLTVFRGLFPLTISIVFKIELDVVVAAHRKKKQYVDMVIDGMG